MSDPDERLSGFDPGPTMNPLPPSDVRRQGDRLRRRNTFLAVGGAVAAIVLIAVPIAVVSGDDGETAPQPAGPTVTVDDLLTPDELPVRDRLTPWQETTAEGQVFACAPKLPVSLDAPTDFRRDFSAGIADAPADKTPASVIRTQVLQFEDAAAARAAYVEARGWIIGCPGGDQLSRKGVSLRNLELEDGQGEWRQHDFYARDICTECDAIRFDRMGVAQFGDRMVLVSLAEVGGPLEPEGLDASMEELIAAAVDKAGGVITGETGSGSSGAASSGEVPEDFPLAAGWPDAADAEPGPDSGLKGPSPSLEPFDHTACGSTPQAPEVTGVLRASWTNPEDYRFRELYSFADVAAATSYVQSITDFYAACPVEDTGDGFTTLRETRETSVGEESYAIIQSSQYDGAPAIGLQLIQVVRVGRAVLVDQAATEGMATDSRNQIGNQADRSAEVVAAMCHITDPGC